MRTKTTPRDIPQLRKLVSTWAPLIRSEPSQELHHRAQLGALITTMLAGRYPL